MCITLLYNNFVVFPFQWSIIINQEHIVFVEYAQLQDFRQKYVINGTVCIGIKVEFAFLISVGNWRVSNASLILIYKYQCWVSILDKGRISIIDTLWISIHDELVFLITGRLVSLMPFELVSRLSKYAW